VGEVEPRAKTGQQHKWNATSEKGVRDRPDVDPGQIDVENSAVQRLVFGETQRALQPVGGADHAIAFRNQDIFSCKRDQRLVIDEQNAFRAHKATRMITRAG
jgi:hypothetical protein